MSMQEYGTETFGLLNADGYDGEHDPGTTAESVTFIADLCRDKRVLELAIGTGRIALPLHQLGIEVHGIDASAEMIEGMRSKPGGSDIPARIADMANFQLDDQFDFAYLVFNTLFNLQTQAAQVACFKQVAAHLHPGGQFLVETVVPDLSLFQNQQYVKTEEISFAGVQIDASTHDPLTQVIERQRVSISAAGTTLKPFIYRYAWPQEIDLMARIAGMQLVNRWGDWHKVPFTARSHMHISLYERTDSEAP